MFVWFWLECWWLENEFELLIRDKSETPLYKYLIVLTHCPLIVMKRKSTSTDTLWSFPRTAWDIGPFSRKPIERKCQVNNRRYTLIFSVCEMVS
jgi:hypothetical protein